MFVESDGCGESTLAAVQQHRTLDPFRRSAHQGAPLDPNLRPAQLADQGVEPGDLVGVQPSPQLLGASLTHQDLGEHPDQAAGHRPGGVRHRLGWRSEAVQP